VSIRSGLRPGDIGEIVRMHGAVYAAEYGLDATFEASMATRLGALAARGWPGPREGLWVAEDDGRPVGTVTLTDEGDGLAQLGHFLLEPQHRGAGTGRRLVEEVLSFARDAGYERVQLFTFSELKAAARLYRAAGFEPVHAEPSHRWGRELVWQRYELRL
jgi:RimJ/RimL family protein N-acetyltransferase